VIVLIVLSPEGFREFRAGAAKAEPTSARLESTAVPTRISRREPLIRGEISGIVGNDMIGSTKLCGTVAVVTVLL
jgi:hypothetical protein